MSDAGRVIAVRWAGVCEHGVVCADDWPDPDRALVDAYAECPCDRDPIVLFNDCGKAVTDAVERKP